LTGEKLAIRIAITVFTPALAIASASSPTQKWLA
jgi:hypothetical protein